MDKNTSKKTSGLGDALDLPNYKHEFMFSYLQISTSYWLAHRVIGLGEEVAKAELPADFDQVLKTYRLLGNVFQKEFYEWWLEGGKDAFATNKKKLFWLGIDPNKSREVLQKEFDAFLNKLDAKSQTPDKIIFQVNKIRMDSLDHRHDLVHQRAWRLGKHWEKEPLWKLIRWGQYPSERRKEIRINSRRKSSNVEVRAYLTMLASKNLKIALNLAENAARGIFPSQEPLETALDFEYERIADQSNHFEFDWEKIQAFKKQHKNWLKYMSPSAASRKARKRPRKYNPDELLEKE